MFQAILFFTFFLTAFHGHAIGFENEISLSEFIGPIQNKTLTKEDLVTNIFKMDQSLRSKSTKKQAWSDTYWPDYAASIAAPYARPLYSFYPGSWAMGKTNWNTFTRKRRRKGARGLKRKHLDKLSPAEKYDLIVGNDRFNFTYKIIERIDELKDLGRLAIWSGVCPGWAAAALREERPSHSIEVMTPFGFPITLYPADIKALATYSWGVSGVQNIAALHGRQCKTRFPKRDGNSRIIDPDCFDVNPGYMHLIMTNLLGRFGKGFVVDIKYKHKVGNHPAYAYSYSYFNPKTFKSVGTIQEATVDLKNGSYYDPFSRYRSPQATQIVGVIANLYFKEEVRPRPRHSDSQSYDKSNTLTLKYELELDSAGNIVGGEWRENKKQHLKNPFTRLAHKHPDIIWHIREGHLGLSDYEVNLSGEDFTRLSSTQWNLKKGLPQSWRKAANQALLAETSIRGHSVANPQPLYSIVRSLIQEASKK